jgi:hypothetical protein
MGRPVTVALFALLVLSTGCPTLDLGEEPAAPGACRPDRLYFEEVIWPDFVNGAGNANLSCVAAAGCHDSNNAARSSMRFETTAPINFQRNYDIMTRFLNCGTPDESSALTKPLAARDPHGGGDLFGDADQATDIFLSWFDL